MTTSLGLARWDDVRFFLAAYRTKSFTKTAKQLGTDQSTVSRRMAALEEELGAALFERTPRGPVATEFAERLRANAEQVEQAMRSLTDSAVHGEAAPRGPVRLATVEAVAIHFLVPRVLPLLAERYPEIELEIVTGLRALDLANQDADIAVRFFRSTRGDLVGRRVARLPLAALCARSLAPRLRRKSVTELPWIAVEVPELGSPQESWLAEHAGTRRALRCNNYEVQLAAMRQGLGVGLVPRETVKLFKDLVALPGLPAMPALELFLVTRRAIREVPRFAAVMKLIAEQLAELDQAG